MTIQSWCKINWNYLPLKAHYFFLFGGCGSIVTFMPVVAKEFGISSKEVGITFTVIPLCVWISKPVFGFIADKAQNIRYILLILLALTGITYFAIWYVPPIRNREDVSTDITTNCTELEDERLFYLSKFNYDSTHDKEITKREYYREILSHYCLNNITVNDSLNVARRLPDNYTGITEFFFKMHGENISNQDWDCLKQKLSSYVCELDFNTCTSFCPKTLSEDRMRNFWIFVSLTVISLTGVGTMWSLSDAACNTILGDNANEYGKQRLWGAISWGIATFASGFFNNHATSNSKYNNYSAGYYLMIGFFVIDSFILCSFRVEKAHTSENICKDVAKIFSSLKTSVFAVVVYLCGIFSGLLSTYEFWFLTDLGSKPLLLGLSAVVQNIVSEVPFFFISGWLVRKIGHFNCLITVLVVYALRFGLYSFLYNPWWVLLIDLSHGVTYSVFFAAMTLFSNEYAPLGTEATTLGILGGIFEGLGVATGSFLGGLGFHSKGGHWTFFVASMISLCSVPLLAIFNIFISRYEGILTLSKEKTVSVIETAKHAYQGSIQ